MNIKKQTRRRLLHFFTVIAAVAALLGSMPDLTGEAASGMLDSTFGSGGKVITAVGNLEDGATSMVIQPDGKIIAAGGSGTFEISDFALVRYNTDGSLDNSFGAGGKVVIDVGGDDGIEAVTLQPDGKIIAAGVSGIFPNWDFALARFNPNGTLDGSFGTGGKVITPIGNGNDEARAVALQSDGKIVAVGLSGNFPNIDFALVRYDINGSLDTSFGTGGKVLTPVGSAEDEAYSMIIQTDGKIVVVGSSFVNMNGADFALVRYNADGSLDNSFGTNGKVTTPISQGSDYIKSIAGQPDGKIVVAGYISAGPTLDIALARYNPNGTLDNGFGTDGKIITAIGGDEIANAVVVQPNGKIIAVGWSEQSTYDFALVRYNPNGTPDNSFGTNGIVLTPIGNSTDFGLAAALQTDGKIIVAGVSYNGANFDFSLARYTNDANITLRSPFDFDGDGKTDISIFRPAPAEWWYLRSSDDGNRAFQFGTSSDRIVPADFTGDGKTDIAVWRPSSGAWFVLRSEDFSFYAFPFGTSGDTPVVGDFDADGRADAGVFRPSNLTWYIQKSAGGTIIQQFGTNGDVPVVADYDGDGRADIAIFRPSNGQWWLSRSTAGTIALTFGVGTDKPVQGDYTGDGKADTAFWRPSTGEWFVLRSEDFSFYSAPFGTSGDSPAPGDYDGDGKFDFAVFRPSTTIWFVQRSGAGILIQQFGTTGDLPVPAAFVP